jgi:5-methyltetrahydrofolate--homocysteine methyltransferase
VLACNNYEVIDLGVMVPCDRILEVAREKRVDVIGLSGLITPSLEEMSHVAREMQREKLSLPLLIGGATTSRAHTAVKIAPHYEQPVIHVLDASRAVGVVSNLLSADSKPAFVKQLRDDYARVRAQYSGQRQRLLSLEDARARAPKHSYDDLPQPEFTGARVITDMSLATLREFIDWSPFFHTWELRGRYPSILDHPKHGEEARKLFADAQTLLDRIITEKLLLARGVYGFFPANRVGDDVELYADHARSRLLTRFHFLRQQMEKGDGQFNLSLADFVAPRGGEGSRTARPDVSGLEISTDHGPSGLVLADYIGAFAVTSGHGLPQLVQRFKADHDDYNAIMAEALADRLAEAFAECLHKRVREEWGYGRGEVLMSEQIIDEQYRGIRPAAGYPACPDHTEKWTLWKLLDVEKNTGMKLTESCMMWPASSVSGLYFAHPEARYFAVGKLNRDQVEDYARRKGMSLADIEKWLAPYLNYESGVALQETTPNDSGSTGRNLSSTPTC